MFWDWVQKKNGVSISLMRNRDKVAGASLYLTSWRYIDNIFECAPLFLLPGDTISLAYHLNIVGKTDGRETSSIRTDFSYTISIQKKQTVSFIRFTKLDSKAALNIYAEFPKSIHTPKQWNATVSTTLH